MRKKATSGRLRKLSAFHGRLPTDNAQLASKLLIEFGRALAAAQSPKKSCGWELLERSELTDALAHYREEEGLN
jgi:hypothetical protein